MTSAYMKRLKKLANEYKKAEPRGARPPSGVYQAEVETAKLQENEHIDGNPLQVALAWKILAGKQRNQRAFDNIILEGEYSDIAMSRLKTLVDRLKIPLGSLDELEDWVAELPGVKAEIAVVDSKKDPRYYNVHVNSLLLAATSGNDEDNDGTEVVDEEDEEDDEPIESEETDEDMEEEVVTAAPRKRKRQAGKPSKKAQKQMTPDDDEGDEFDFDF